MPLNGGHDYREQLGPDAEGRSLVVYLSDRYGHSSADEWLTRITAGDVRLDGSAVGPESPLHSGQILTWRRPPWSEPEAPTAFTVLHEDDDLLAVDKPAGLPTLPGAQFLENTLLRLVRARAPGAAPLHRLGRWTSGIVLFALTAESRAEVARQWRARTIGKRYRALASGTPESDDLTIRDPIGCVAHAKLGQVHAASIDGKPATTRITVLERRGTECFLCDVRIETGRPHQIRIHLASSGHPLVGDPLYVAGGVPAPDSTALPGDPGYHLHATELTLRHPRTGHALVLASTPPEILRPISS